MWRPRPFTLDSRPWFTVPALLTPQECALLKRHMEALGIGPAPISTRMGPVMRPDYRNNERAMSDDPATASWLYERLRRHLPAEVDGGQLVGLNERLRWYRYLPGQRFAPHRDGCFRRDALEASELTLLVYLDGECGGGRTLFLEFDEAVTPAPGLALVFPHALLHEGEAVTSGVKHVLRSDVMYRLPAPSP